jgi:hypothetical protein
LESALIIVSAIFRNGKIFMQIHSSSTSFSAGQVGSMADMSSAPFGALASGASNAARIGAYLQGQQDGARFAAADGGPRIYSPDSMDAGAGGAAGNCPDGKCSSGGSGGGGDIGQVLTQLLQALAPMMQAVAPIAGMMGGMGGGKAA